MLSEKRANYMVSPDMKLVLGCIAAVQERGSLRQLDSDRYLDSRFTFIN